jgi:hypothetical protein
MDDVAARRTQAGAPVVHGVHAVLWTLESLAQSGVSLDALRELRVRFKKFIYVDAVVSVRVLSSGNDVVKAELIASDVSCATVTLWFGDRSVAEGESLEAKDVVTNGQPISRTLDELSEVRGWLVPPERAEHLVTECFPLSTGALGVERMVALAQLSTLVGMVCPGLYSIFAEFSVAVVDANGERRGIGFRTTKIDSRFRLVTMRAAGSGLAGEVSAFVRTKPIEPPTMASLAGRVGAHEFADSVSLIVGGSRGLGAVTAKLLARGGGRVIVTYARGEVEASALARDISSDRGTAACSVLQLDVTKDAAATLATVAEPITHVYYFATPQIFRQKSDAFSKAMFDEFAAVYLGGFSSTVEALVRSRGSLRVLNPSSIAVTDRPKGMTEYAMAKVAAELLCVDLTRLHPGLRIDSPRLPRILTDQTATVSIVDSDDAVETLLPLMRSLHAP